MQKKYGILCFQTFFSTVAIFCLYLHFFYLGTKNIQLGSSNVLCYELLRIESIRLFSHLAQQLFVYNL